MDNCSTTLQVCSPLTFELKQFDCDNHNYACNEANIVFNYCGLFSFCDDIFYFLVIVVIPVFYLTITPTIPGYTLKLILFSYFHVSDINIIYYYFIIGN